MRDSNHSSRRWLYGGGAHAQELFFKTSDTARYLGRDITITLIEPNKYRAMTLIDQAFNEMRYVDSLLRSSDALAELNENRRLKQPSPGLVDLFYHIQDTAASLGEAAPYWSDIKVSDHQVILGRKVPDMSFGDLFIAYAIGTAARFLKENGVRYALIDAGSITQAIGQKTESKPWKVPLADPNNEDVFVTFIDLDGEGVVRLDQHYLPTFAGDLSELAHPSLSVVAKTALEALLMAEGIQRNGLRSAAMMGLEGVLVMKEVALFRRPTNWPEPSLN